MDYCIKFKLPTLTYHTLATLQPPYLASLLHLSNIQRQLGPSTSHLQHFNRPTWLVSCIYQTSKDNSDHLPHTCNTSTALLGWSPASIKHPKTTRTIYLTLATLQPPYLASLLHLSNIRRQLGPSTTHSQHFNRPTWLVSCIYQTSKDNSDHLPHTCNTSTALLG